MCKRRAHLNQAAHRGTNPNSRSSRYKMESVTCALIAILSLPVEKSLPQKWKFLRWCVHTKVQER